jgi:clan AA aspartic protease (TIGR02281 family)
MEMKSLLKPLAIAAMSIAAMSIAVTTAANAIELMCSKPTIYVGQQSKNANDTVVQVDVRHTSAGWQVHHRLGGGLIAEREHQYTIQDLSNQSQNAWKGSSNRYPGFWMIGEIQRNKANQLIYVEWLYGPYNDLRMHAATACIEQVALWSPPAQTPASPPASVTKRDSVPINVINGRAVTLNVSVGQHTVTMMLDTGASTTTVTNEFANSLVRDGHARWSGERQFKLADGFVISAPMLTINEVRLGAHVVRNVEASVTNDSLMLLGFSVVDQIGPFMINTRKRELIFETPTVNNLSANDAS